MKSKVTLSLIPPRSSLKVIKFFCGPSVDKAAVVRYGRSLVRLMGYGASGHDDDFPPFIYYKSEEQSRKGTAATGRGRNWLYRVQF